MLYKIADFRARVILLQEEGFMGYDRYIMNDELRLSARQIMHSPKKNKILVKLDDQTSKQRAHYPSRLSTSLKAATLILSASMEGTKLRPLIIFDNAHMALQRTRSRQKQQIVQLLNLPPNQAKRIPEQPIITAKNEKSWSNARVHAGVYLEKVVKPHLTAIKADVPDLRKAKPAPQAVEFPPHYASAAQHASKHPRAVGSFQKCAHGKLPSAGEVHDSFPGHTASFTRTAYSLMGLFTAMIAANCTGWLQWSDKYLHHRFREVLWPERLLRARASDEQLTAKEWRELQMLAVVLVWYNPSFFPRPKSKPRRRQRASRPLLTAVTTHRSP